MALGGEDAKYNKGYVKATQKKSAPVADEWGSQAMWDAAAPNLTPAIQGVTDAGYTVGSPDFYSAVGGANSAMNESAAAGQPLTMQDVVNMLLQKNTQTQTQGSGVQNRAAIIDALRARLKADPYAAMTQQLQKNYATAQTTGNTAVTNLRQALGGMQNAYKDVKFATPVSAGNPLADYMAASGSGTGEVDALRGWLSSLSQDAAGADADMVRRLRASTQQDINGRQADVGFAETAWRQMLANQLQSQQAAIAQAKAARDEDILMQLAQMGAKG